MFFGFFHQHATTLHPARDNMGKILFADEETINYEHFEGADYLTGGLDAFNTSGGSGEDEFNVSGSSDEASDLHFTAFGVDSLSDLVGKDMELKEDVVFVDGVPDFNLVPKAGDALGPVFLCKGGCGFYLMNIKTKIPQSISWSSQEEWCGPIEARRKKGRPRPPPLQRKKRETTHAPA